MPPASVPFPSPFLLTVSWAQLIFIKAYLHFVLLFFCFQTYFCVVIFSHTWSVSVSLCLWFFVCIFFFQICSSNDCPCNKFLRSHPSGSRTNPNHNTHGLNMIFVSPAIRIIMAQVVPISVVHGMINLDTTHARRRVKLSV